MAAPTHTEEYPNRVFEYPVDYFKGDARLAESVLTQPVIYTTLSMTLLGASAFYNYNLGRPFLSGVHRHFGLVGVGLVIGYFFHHWRLSNLAERDAAIRHYVELHPEDFPRFERRQFKDIFQPWIPRR